MSDVQAPSPVVDDPERHLLGTYNRLPVTFVAGDGVWLEDDAGRRYLDALSGIAVNALGHGHPALIAAIRDQAGRLLHTSNLFGIAPQAGLAARLCQLCFADRVYFCNSGAEANEAAYKLVRRWGNLVHEGRKTRLVSAEGAFHGRTTAALALTGTAAYHEGFAPLPAVDFVPYGDTAALEAALGDEVAGLWLEPLQGEGGVKVPPPGYLARARELCDRHGVVLVFDEVQVGCGRTGRMFCHQHEGVEPDVMCLAKGLGGGVPIGAMLCREAYAGLLPPGTHASTFGGNHLASAAANAVVETLSRPGFLARVAAVGERLRAGLTTLFAGRCREVRGRGLLIGVALDEDPRPLMRSALEAGLVCGIAGDRVLRLAPPLVIDEAEVDELLQRLETALG